MAQTTGKIELTLRASKRWFFWPALAVIVLLGHVGVLRDQRRVAKWLADHAMRIEVV